MSYADAIPGLYARHAEAFDRVRGKNGFERPWLDLLVAPLSPGASVLDIGCGSGEPIAADLIDRGFVVTGLDVSEPLIRLCRQRFPAHDWHVGDMRDLPSDGLFRRSSPGTAFSISRLRRSGRCFRALRPMPKAALP